MSCRGDGEWQAGFLKSNSLTGLPHSREVFFLKKTCYWFITKYTTQEQADGKAAQGEVL